MKIFVYDRTYAELYNIVKRLLSREKYEFLSETSGTGIISSYKDSEALKLLDIKITKTIDGLRIFLISSEMNAKGCLITDPEAESNFVASLLNELKSVKEYCLSPYDYYMVS
jgi:hypothetical protein